MKPCLLLMQMPTTVRLRALLEELGAFCTSSVLFIETLDDETLNRIGTANGYAVSEITGQSYLWASASSPKYNSRALFGEEKSINKNRI